MSPHNTISFKEHLLDNDQFTLTFELVPSRGGRSKGHSRIIDLAREAALDGRLQAVSITENAGGHPALSPEVLGIEIKKMGLEVISHFSCKDKNRNQMESLLFGWDREGLHNLLVITGDYPQHGYHGKPKPVFDLDSVQALDLISQMNSGVIHSDPGKSLSFPPTSFIKGVALSPFKLLRSELYLQYAKLHSKIEAGADYIITQLGFDARKYHEVLLYLQQHNIKLPILGNVFVPNLTVTKMMYRGAIPGCIIPTSLYNTIMAEAESEDRGKRARLFRAAKLLAILKGLGYSGAHIGGPGLSFADLDIIINEAEKLAADWQSLIPELSYWPAEGFYYYCRDEKNGLNLPDPTPEKWSNRRRSTIGYDFSHSVHQLFFEPDGALFKITGRCCLALDKAGHSNKIMKFEYFIKLLLFGCQNCGDCRLAELAYFCPYSRCAKYLLNGACGGSRDGWCEVYPKSKRCFYVLIYERLKAKNFTGISTKDFSPPRDWSKNNSSSWLNFFHQSQDDKKDIPHKHKKE